MVSWILDKESLTEQSGARLTTSPLSRLISLMSSAPCLNFEPLEPISEKGIKGVFKNEQKNAELSKLLVGLLNEFCCCLHFWSIVFVVVLICESLTI